MILWVASYLSFPTLNPLPLSSGNACGTIASVHAVANAAAAGHFALTSGSVLETFVAKTTGTDAAAKGWELAKTKELHELSEETAASGETEGAGTNDANDSHFICFTHVGGVLYELDGRVCDEEGMAFPVSHGATTAETFVADAAKVPNADTYHNVLSIL